MGWGRLNSHLCLRVTKGTYEETSKVEWNKRPCEDLGRASRPWNIQCKGPVSWIRRIEGEKEGMNSKQVKIRRWTGARGRKTYGISGTGDFKCGGRPVGDFWADSNSFKEEKQLGFLGNIKGWEEWNNEKGLEGGRGVRKLYWSQEKR